MRIAIFSDVHANADALRSVLSTLESLQIDHYACLGDIVGYGGDPETCCTLVRGIATWTVLGNHDAAVARRMNYDYYYSSARDALDQHRQELSEPNLQWLKDLPWTVREHDFLFSHGRPDNPQAFEYMFNENHAKALLDSYSSLAPVNFIGHSHLTRAYRLQQGGEREIIDVSSSKITLDEGARYVITVGSVGQPRDHDPRACCVVYDTDERTVTFHRVRYDVRAAAMKIWANDKLSPEFAKRLYLGV